MSRWIVRIAIPVALIGGLAALVGPAVRDRLGPPLARGLAAYAARDYETAERLARRQLEKAPNDRDATRLLARSYGRLDRHADALALFLGLGATEWQAEDLVLVGRGLIADGRTVLGWAAFDAAAKLEPRNREAGVALADLSGRVETLGESVRQADLITAVPNGRALTELVAGLIGMTVPSPRPDTFDPTLHRLCLRDRATLSAVDSPEAAFKLLARLQLQAGRPAEARNWLGRVDERSADPETHWLLSRCHLLEGDAERASEALEKAGRFGADTPLAHEPGVYAGARSCAECHSAIHQSEQNGPHGRTIGWGKALETVPLPRGVLTDPHDPKVTHHFERTGERIKAEARVGDKTIDAVIGYALGSGHHGVTMLGRGSNGRYRSLRMSYYSGGDHWALTSGFEPHPRDPAEFLGIELSPSNFAGCLNCHTTRFASEQDREGPEARDNGIGCEKCHGPGANHIKAIADGFPQLAIARPKIATPRERIALCGQCHGADGKIPPSDPRYIRFQSTTLPYSRCVTESGGKLDCVSCHDPHQGVVTQASHYETRCLACHGEKAPVQDKAVRLEAVRASRCKVNPRDGCLSCHMPKSENVLPFTSFTDHHIRVHRPADAPAARARAEARR